MTHPLPPAYASAPPRRPVRVWDVVLTIVLLALLVVLTLFLSFFGAFFGMASDGCGGSRECNTALLTLGVFGAMGSPWVVLAVTVGVSIALLLLRRLAFWVPLAGAAVAVVLWLVAAGVTMAGVPT